MVFAGFSNVASASSESAHSSGKPPKNLKNLPSGGPKIDPRASRIAFRSPFRATWVEKVDRRGLFERSWGDLVGRKGLSERLSRRLGSILARSGPQNAARRFGVRKHHQVTSLLILYTLYSLIYEQRQKYRSSNRTSGILTCHGSCAAGPMP